MTVELIDEVRSNFLPEVQRLGFVIVDQKTSNSFGNALVVVEAAPVRVIIERDRGYLAAYMGSTVEPDTTFTLGTVMEFVGLTTTGGAACRDAHLALAGLAGFLNSMWPELVAMFNATQFPATKLKLSQLGSERADRLFGR